MTKTSSAINNSATWIRRNMMGIYSEKYQRPLTVEEIRFQKTLENMEVPDWYRNYMPVKPMKILKNLMPIECRPSAWKNIQPRRIFNEEQIEYNSCSEQEINPEPVFQQEVMENCNHPYIDRIKSNTFPRRSPSRKIENLNIELSPQEIPGWDFTEYDLQDSEVSQSDVSKSNVSKSDESHSEVSQSHVSQSDVSLPDELLHDEPIKVKDNIHSEKPKEYDICKETRYLQTERADSPYTRFRNSPNKSTELEKIVKNKKRSSGSFVQEMVYVLERDANFLKNHLGSSGIESEEIYECDSVGYSTSLSCFSKSDASSKSSECCSDESFDEDVHWIKVDKFRLPFCSSAMSSDINNLEKISPSISPVSSSTFYLPNKEIHTPKIINLHSKNSFNNSNEGKKSWLTDSGFSESSGITKT